jgi:hypothetical protein
MEHAIHLSAKHVADTIAPTPLSKLVSKVKAVLQTSANLDILDKHVEQILAASCNTQLGDGDDDNDLKSLMSDAVLSDALGVALAIAAQVSNSI